MKPHFLIILSTIFVLPYGYNYKSGVIGNSAKTLQAKKAIHSQATENNKPAVDNTHKLISYMYLHEFSDATLKDKFKITLYGKNIINGFVVFEINDYKNKRIFKEQFPSLDLVGDRIDVLSQAQEKDTIKVRMAHFFDKKHFISPAIKNGQTIDQAFPNYNNTDKSNWSDVKSNHSSVGFYYSHGYEGNYEIAYSKKQHKVVEVFYRD